MHFRFLPLGALTALSILLLVQACGDSVVQPIGPSTAYVDPNTPTAVVENLAVSYRRREIEQYAALLHPQFEFEFQDADVITQGERLNRDQDFTGTHGLFASNRVLAISLEVSGTVAAPVTEVGFPEGAMKIRLNLVNLQVDDDQGTTFLVTDQQDMFFLPNPADTTTWQLFRWRDNPSGGSFSRLQNSEEPTTWGGVKTRFAAANAAEETSWGSLKTRFR